MATSSQSHTPPPQRSWTIDAFERRFLQDFVRANRVRSVLEFGPGESSEAFLECGCNVCSLEHDPKWCDALRRMLGARAGLEILLYRVEPELAIPELAGRQFDLALVDGPPSGLFRRFARLNTMEFAASRAGIVMLHDALRPKEQNTLMVLEEKGWQWRLLRSARGLAVGTREGRNLVWP